MTLIYTAEIGVDTPPGVKRLTDVILGCNPAPTSGGRGWGGRTRRVCDIDGEAYGPGAWSLSCHDGVIHNSTRVVGPGTLGWIYRSDGGWGHLAGLIGFTGHPYLAADGEVYCEGVLFPLPTEWWLPGEDINAAGWSNRAPWGDTTPTRFQNGQELVTADISVLEGLIHPAVRAWVRDRRQLWTP